MADVATKLNNRIEKVEKLAMDSAARTLASQAPATSVFSSHGLATQPSRSVSFAEIPDIFPRATTAPSGSDGRPEGANGASPELNAVG